MRIVGNIFTECLPQDLRLLMALLQAFNHQALPYYPASKFDTWKERDRRRLYSTG